MAQAPREQWASRTGFVLAAVGSAVGLGNMWRFSYLTAENGGAAFVVLYLLMTLFIGLPVMLAELVVGRGAPRSPIEALAHYGGSRWRWLGALFVATGFLILAYYSVIAGWTLRYALLGIVGGFAGDSAARFDAFSISCRQPRAGDMGESWSSARSAFPRIAIRMLLKSWAMPPASTPRLSSFCACCSWR